MSRIQTSCLSLTPTHSPASSVSAILLESGASFFPTPSALEFRRLTLKRFPFEFPSTLPPASPDYQSEQVIPHSKAPSVAPLALKRAATLLHVGPKPCTTSSPDLMCCQHNHQPDPDWLPLSTTRVLPTTVHAPPPTWNAHPALCQSALADPPPAHPKTRLCPSVPCCAPTGDMAIIWVNSPVNCEVPGVRGCVLAIFASPASAQHPELALREDWLGWFVWPQCSVKFNLFAPRAAGRRAQTREKAVFWQDVSLWKGMFGEGPLRTASPGATSTAPRHSYLSQGPPGLSG